MKQWKRLAALSSAIVMAAATLTYFPNDTLQNIRLEISASAEDASAVTWTKTESDGLTWTLYEDGTLNISGTGEMRGYNAYSIKSPACDNSNIKNVMIEDGITSIGSFAFYGCSLTNIRIPGSVTSIGKCAIEDCMSLTSVTIPGSVSSIGEYAFRDCRNLTDATILDGVTSIENRAFWGCSRLTSVTIPNSVTNIGESAFWNCNKLTSVTIPDGVTSIEDLVFSSCYSLTSITMPNSVTSIGNSAFRSCTKLTSITIPDGVISIGNFAFSGCNELSSITIPDSVTSIGDSAFEECRILTSISIPDSVTSIGGNVFKNCTRLKTISLSCKSSLKKSDFGEQANLVSASHILKKTAAKAVTCTENGNKEYWTCEHCGKYFLSDDANPETAKAVEQSEFIIPALKHKNATTRDISEPTETAPGYSGDLYCPDCDTVLEKGYTYWKEDNLTWTLYADGTLNISGKGAMKNYSNIDDDNLSPAYRNSNVRKIVIEDGVTSIGNNAFYVCSRSTSITIPDSVTSIGDDALAGCVNLTSITIPKNVTSIGHFAFSNCNNLTSITIPDSVTSIGDFAFSNCSLTSITIPSSVTSIGRYAFYKCTGLTSITIPDSVKNIEPTAFDSCSSLKTISLSCKSSLKKSNFGDQANLVSALHTLKKKEAKSATCTENGSNKEYWTCEHCGKYFLSDDANPETAKAVEQSEFIIPALNHKNAYIRNASEPNGTKSGYTGDRYCPDCNTVLEKGYTYWIEDNLTWKLYEDGTLNISGTGAMKNYIYGNNKSPARLNLSVTSIVIEEGVTSIGDYAFENCDNLTSITIPGNVESIGEGAFYSCNNLTDVTLQDGVKSIGDSAFIWCNNLTNIVLPNSVTSIGNYAFYNCSSLTSITIPDSVTSIGNAAFENCSSLKTISLSCGSALKKSDFGKQADLVSYTNQHTLTKTAAKAATCSESGNKEYWTCEHCGKYFLSDDTNPATATAVELSETVIPASHKLTKVEAKDATCTENGNKAYWTCEHCKKYFLSDDTNPATATAVELSETVIPASHKLTKVEAKAATCTEKGNKEYWTCEHCGKYFLSDDTNPETAKAVEQSETILPAIQHKNAELRNSSEPTETSPGYSGDLYCPDCDKVVEKGYTYWIEDNLTWKLYEDGTLNISGTGAMKNYIYGNNKSPARLNLSVTSIVIEEGVTSIGDYAFENCDNLTSITIPGNVESIGERAFYHCDNLTDVTLQDGVKSIGNAAFIWCNNLTNIVLPNSVTSIGYYAFKDCTSLTSITIPDSVTSIGNDAFKNCSSLKTISLSCKSTLKKSDFDDQADLVSYTNQHILTKTAAKDATCSEDGNKAYWTCEHCGKYFLSDDTNPATATAVELSETVIPASHKLTKVEAKDATCTENGNKAYWTCEHCKKYFLSDDTNPKTATAVELSETVISASHKLTKVEAKDATYAENGNKEYWTCEHCKKYFLSDDTNPETATAVELSETVIPALVQVATTTTPIKCVYGQDMNKIDLRDYVKNTDVVGEVTVKVATGSTLPDGMKLDGSKLSGKPAKAYEDGKEVTFTFTAENGNTANLTLLFLVAKADPTVEVAVNGDSHTEGDMVSELKLILSENSTKGVVELVSEIKALVAGKNTLTWKFTPEDENNYNMVTGTVVVNAQTTTTTTTTTKATTTTTKATTTTKPSKTTTTNATTTTKPSKTTTTTTKATTTTKPSKTTTTNAMTTTKPSKTTTTKTTTTTKPNKTTTTKVTTTTKPSKTTTTNATTTNTAIPSYGDVNLDGKVDIVDAIFLNKYLATLIQFSDAQMANADCCQDGVLNDQDTTALMQFIILLIDDLPVQPTEK